VATSSNLSSRPMLSHSAQHRISDFLITSQADGELFTVLSSAVGGYLACRDTRMPTRRPSWWSTRSPVTKKTAGIQGFYPTCGLRKISLLRRGRMKNAAAPWVFLATGGHVAERFRSGPTWTRSLPPPSRRGKLKKKNACVKQVFRCAKKYAQCQTS